MKTSIARARRFLNSAAHLSLVAGLLFGLIWSPVAFAVEVELKRSLQLRMLDDQNRSRSGVLKAGSRLAIPDRYQVKNSKGQVDLELTLNNWLKTAGRTGYAEPDRARGLVVKSGIDLDYFYPLKIVEAAPGSVLPTRKGKHYFLSLRVIQRQSGELRTRVDASLEQDADDDESVAPALEAASAAAGPCLDGACQSRTASDRFEQLVLELGPALRRTESRLHLTKRRTSVDMRSIGAQFKRSCGFELTSFIPIVRRYAASAGIPSPILLSMMVQESSGKCYSNATNNDGSHDSGLFGVNSGTAGIRRCSAGEISLLKNLRPDRLENGPRCIENPLVNLQAAVRIMTDKANAITRSLTAKTERLSGFSGDRLRDRQGRYTASAWRIITSAYNGGERWVLQAKTDLEAFNRKNGTALNPYNWEDLRIFYLRAHLSDHRQIHYFGSAKDGREKSAIFNLAYAENVVPQSRMAANRSPGSGRDRSPGPSRNVANLADIWQRDLRL